MRPASKRRAWSYLLALVFVVLAIGAQDLIYHSIGGAPSPFLLTYPAVFFAVWFGGLGPGLLSTSLSALAAWYWFLPPVHSFDALAPSDLLKLGVFVVMGGVFSILLPASQRKLRQLNHDFVTLLERTSDFIYFKDENGRVRFCSRTMAQVAGRQDWRELVGKDDLEIFPEETARIYQEEDRAVFRDGKPLLNKVDPFFDAQGHRRWASTNKWPVLAKDEQTVIGVFGISRDITEQKRAAEELQRQSIESAMLLRSAVDGIHILDAKGNVLRASDEFCQMLGYTNDEVLKLHVSQWDERWTARELEEQVLPRLLHGREVFETKHRRHDGSLIDVEVSATGVELGGARVIFAASRDITERKLAEARLRRLTAELREANRLKDIFTDVLRHDVLSPVFTIKLATDLLLKSESDDQRFELLQRIARCAANIVEMAENSSKLASVTANEAPELVTVDPVQLLRAVVLDFQAALEEKPISLTNHSGRGFSARVNPMIKDVFTNLISNAIKYSPSGSMIDVCAEEDGDRWSFTVKDQGVGVPEEHRDKIFNRFERLERAGVKGSGLGLTIAKQIVRLHHGEIGVEGNPGGGSIFFVRLPKNPQSVSSKPP